ncbi:pre-piRNA 3'-exonuclease trimmer-like [Sitophilus oryzae]|uniref:Pre-piRNA 3'-exonuclease trimmer-like n=1 Tax=Sitophilus oryzae TaxID=7048 RepID=A0A6J2XQ76_SITOR|nr:pre-piRNA 3'-exonuclease trimmer-like [Sitophilus oryzae]
MCEININNFSLLYPEIKKSFQDAKFIGVDFEFSALNPIVEFSPSIFDSPSERYYKLKANIENVVPLQVGLTAFIFDSKKNSYCGKIYTFYVQPACFQHIHRNFYFQSSTINFLKSYNFDFNKFAYSGISFINKDQELELRRKFKNGEIFETNCGCRTEIEEFFNREGEVIKSWYEKALPGEFLTVPKVRGDLYYNEETLYFLQKTLRNRFQNIWTFIKNREFIVKKVSKDDRDNLEKTDILEEKLLDSLLGFSKVIQLLITLKKPIIGHNFIQDLLLMVNNFEQALPPSYNQFKELIPKLFPLIFDTRTISYGLRSQIPEEKQWVDTGLDSIFDYFKNKVGRHIAPNSPAIEIENQENSYGKKHDAGWDSFCAGYIFIRLAHLNIYDKYPSSKVFVSSEYIGGLTQYKNKVNLIRCSVPNINFDGPDPVTTRPPYLVIESRKNQAINISQVTSLLSSFGFVEIRKMRFARTKALVAVDNFGNARRILRGLKSNADYRVIQYTLLRHSPIARICLIGGVSLSGALVVWLTHIALKK